MPGLRPLNGCLALLRPVQRGEASRLAFRIAATAGHAPVFQPLALVIPTEVGIHPTGEFLRRKNNDPCLCQRCSWVLWIPAGAGMTKPE